MIKHVIMWKFREGEEENMHKFIDGLRALKGVIPEILELEVGVDYGGTGHYDAVLISTFESREALDTYKKDPRHVAVSNLCKSIRTDRIAVDYEF